MKRFLLCIVFFVISLVHSQKTEKSISNNNEAFSEITIAQDSIQDDYKLKRASIGIKLGVPNIASIGIQYTLPFLSNHIAPYFDYSSYNYKDTDIEGSLSFSELGASYFFNKKGKGLYLGLGVSSLKIDATYNDVSLDQGRTGSGTSKIELNTTNFKLGYKTGGFIFIRLELGYGIGDLPETVTFTAKDNSNSSYTETTTEDIPSIPGVSEKGLMIGNIGLGLSF